MKTKATTLTIILFLAIIFSCERERINPWDDKTNLDPSAWAPQNLQIEDVTITEKKLTWTYDDENIEGFKLDRKKGDEAWHVAYQVFPTETRSWNDAEIVPDPSLSYSYRLYAYAGSNSSEQQNASANAAVAAPNNLQITNNSITSVTLGWQDNSTGEDGFKIERKYDGSNWESLATVTTNNYEDKNFNLNTLVYYRVCAYYGTYASFWVETNFDATIPPPENLQITPNSVTSVTLSWDYNFTGNDGFRIDRKVNEGAWVEDFTTVNSGTTYSDNSLDLNNNVYYYRVYAYYGQQYESVKTESLVTLKCGYPFTDSRDGHEYETVQIGDQCWMKENLAWLPSVSDPDNGSQTSPYYYVYGYEGTNVSEAKATANYQTYGVLYNWPASLTACPQGWHLPEDAEWTVLTDYLGETSVVGGKMKEAGTGHWNSPNTGANNSSGFTALPGGYRRTSGYFDYLSYYGYWWSSTEYSSADAWYRRLNCNYADVYRGSNYKELGFSVRCVRDE